ncbi:MAG TPA: PfkB family carbohydrate kinase, partial [Chloroflexota bacterium]|nr:PfkB family carbohydrate kinase [Chloroflexota bacterium]
SALDDAVSDRMVEFLRTRLDSVDAVVVSDYENGVINPRLVRTVLPGEGERELMVAVDSHGDLFRFRGATVATPNQPEAEATLHRQIDSLAELENAGDELLRGMEAEAVLITRGSEGMSLFTSEQAPLHLPPSNLREVFDPTGAGDTTCAVFALALLSGASHRDAALLSSVAAGEVVKRLGATALNRQELAAAFEAAAGPTGT